MIANQDSSQSSPARFEPPHNKTTSGVGDQHMTTKVSSTVNQCPECGGSMIGGCCDDCGHTAKIGGQQGRETTHNELTNNAWTEEAREAAAEARKSSKSVAKSYSDTGLRHANKAVEHLQAGNPGAAAEAHEKAAKYHEKAAKESDDEQERAGHRKAEADHAYAGRTLRSAMANNSVQADKRSLWRKLGETFGILSPVQDIVVVNEEISGIGLGPGNHGYQKRADYAKRLSGSVDEAEKSIDDASTDEDLNRVRALHKQAEDAHTAAFHEAAEGRATGAVPDYASAGSHIEAAKRHAEAGKAIDDDIKAAKLAILGKKMNTTNAGCKCEGSCTCTPTSNAWSDEARQAALEARQGKGKNSIKGWSTFAGGTSAAEGKHGHSVTTEHGEYHISPTTTSSGRHAGYSVQFADSKGKVVGAGGGGGLWHDLGRASSPSEGKAMASAHHEFISKKLTSNVSDLESLVGNARSEEARQAAAEARKSSDRAYAKSDRAGFSVDRAKGLSHSQAAEIHERHAAYHQQMATAAEGTPAEHDHRQAFAAHKSAAADHLAAAKAKANSPANNQATDLEALVKNQPSESQLEYQGITLNQGEPIVAFTKEQRKKLVDGLVTNCGGEGQGVFNEEDRDYLSKLSDIKLSGLVRQNLAANKKADPDDDDDDDEDMEKNAGGDNHSFDSGMKGSSAQAGDKGLPSEYPAEKNLKVNKWYQQQPPEVREIFDDAMQVRGQEKVGLIDRIIKNRFTANSDQKQVQNAKKYLAEKSLKELRTIASLLPPAIPQRDVVVNGMLPNDPVTAYLNGGTNNYAGAAGASTYSGALGGREDAGDALGDPPVNNQECWKEALKEQGFRGQPVRS